MSHQMLSTPNPAPDQRGANIAPEVPPDDAGGEFALPLASSFRDGNAATSGRLVLTGFTARRSESVASLTMWTGGTAAAATPTLCKYGLFEVTPAGLTAIAVTANDTALFVNANTAYPKAFTAPALKVAGRRYAAGVLVVSAVARPSLISLDWPIALTALYTGAASVNLCSYPWLCGRVDGQTDITIGTLIAASSLGTAAEAPLARLVAG